MSITLAQSYIVYQREDCVCVRGQVDNEEHITSLDACEAIQHAIDLLPVGGGEVNIQPGNYLLSEPLQLRDNISLRGQSRGTKLIIDHSGSGLLVDSCKGVEISNLMIANCKSKQASSGIVLNGCVDCKVHDLFCVGFAEYGIWVRNESILCEIRGCSLAGNGKANLFFDHHRRGIHGDFVPNLVSNCVIYGGGKGIECAETTVLNIIACIVYQTTDIAFHLHGASYSVLISGCRTFQIGGDAVVVENCGELNLSSNIFCWHIGNGIVVKNCGWGTISGNEIIDSGSYNPNAKDFSTRIDEVPPEVELAHGLSLHNVCGFSITGNTIFNWPQARRMAVGIYEDGECQNNTIVANNINYYAGDGIVSDGNETIVARNTLEKDVPHRGNSEQVMLQSFEWRLTKDLIEELASLK
ncbi:MAG: right-handed parallel beta-helix repeat-containing protein [Aggregatilineales bacterium]